MSALLFVVFKSPVLAAFVATALAPPGDIVASVLAFLQANWLAVLVAVLLVAWLIYRISLQGLRTTIVKLIFAAETWYKSADGQARMTWVLAQLPTLVGGWMWRLLVLMAMIRGVPVEDYLRGMVQDLFDAAKALAQAPSSA